MSRPILAATLFMRGKYYATSVERGKTCDQRQAWKNMQPTLSPNTSFLFNVQCSQLAEGQLDRIALKRFSLGTTAAMRSLLLCPGSSLVAPSLVLENVCSVHTLIFHWNVYFTGHKKTRYRKSEEK